jgi:ribonuclease-3
VTDPERQSALATLQQRLGYAFRDEGLLDCALTHKSYANELGLPHHYERLEFLGDAVLELVVSTYLYSTYPSAHEGQLSKLRSCLVNAEAFATLARQLELGSLLRLGRGEARSGGHNKNSLLAAALEAVVGALYLDGGFVQAQDIFMHCFSTILDTRVHNAQVWDYKGLLQEQTLSLFGCTPSYHVVCEEGPAHQKTFHVQLSLNQEVYDCIGTGRSKKAAEQHAARQLLARLQSIDNDGPPV